MLYWCLTLFILGVMAFLDTFYNYGEIFQRVNSILFMLISLGLLIRTRMMMKAGKFEKLSEENKVYRQQFTPTDHPNAVDEKEEALV
jgi:hypothetical protein